MSEPIQTPIVTTPAPQRRNGLAIAGIVVGSVVVAGALFGGGVVVGTHIPHGQSMSQFHFQGGFGGRPGNGERPQRPNQGTQSNGNSDSTQP